MNRTNKVKLLLLSMLVVTFLFGKFQGGFVSWFLFHSTVVLYGYIWLVIRYSLQRIKVTRTFKHTRIHTNEEVEAEIIITNYSSFPHPYLIIKDDPPEKLRTYAEEAKIMVFPWFRSKSFVQYKIPNAVRGLHRFREIEITTGDLFGFVRISRKIPVYGEVVVYPKSYPIELWNTRNPRNIGHSYSENRSSEETGSVIGIREYRMGDRFNRIHWKQSAKVMHWMTKEFERFSTNDFMFFIDQERMKYENNKDHFEALVELTASLIQYASSKRFSIGIISEGKSRLTVSLGRGQEQLRKSYEILALLEPESTIPFAHTVLNETHILPVGTTIVLIVSSVTKSLHHLIAELTIKRYKVELFVLSSDKVSNENVQLQSNLGVTTHHLTLDEWKLRQSYRFENQQIG